MSDWSRSQKGNTANPPSSSDFPGVNATKTATGGGGDCESTSVASLRILCLHDANSNAEELQRELDGFGERLYKKHDLDLVYVNSPLVVSGSASASSPTTSKGNTPLRVWWEEPQPAPPAAAAAAAAADQKEISTTTQPQQQQQRETDENEYNSDTHIDGNIEQQHQQQFIGLDASLLLLRQVWTSCPFWGILGVGQGAAMAALLALLFPAQQQQQALPPPSVCIYCSGQTVLPERERLVDEASMACLHLVDDDDDDVDDDGYEEDASVSNSGSSSPASIVYGSERLIRQFGGQVHVRSTQKQKQEEQRRTTDKTKRACHCRSRHFSKSDWNVMGQFLIRQKKCRLFESAENRQIVALQTALYAVEQDAARKIADEIAANPPAALMAVIRPQDVGGWSGLKRRQPGEEGGGAPCPSEFLLKRDKRPTKVDCASRVHPANQQELQETSDEHQQQDADSEVQLEEEGGNLES